MRFVNYFFLAFSSIRQRKLRSWLTMIGIFIGIAAVVSLISIGQGLQGAVTSAFNEIGVNKLYIQPAGIAGARSVEGSSKLTDKDIEIIKDVAGVEEVNGFVVKTARVEYRGEQRFLPLVGVEPDSKISIFHANPEDDVVEGRYLKDGDRYRVVVAYNLAFGDLFSDLKIRDNIEVEGKKFKVVGILEKTGDPFADSSLEAPRDVVEELFDSKGVVDSIIVTTKQGFNPSDVANDIKKKLRRARGLEEGKEDFEIRTTEDLLRAFGNIFNIVQAVLVGIAAISLLVGGVGIMNTMYTSILERTRDIGIMKAIGAKNSDILVLFLVESGLLGMLGGLIGIGLGLGLAKSVEYIAIERLGTDLLRASVSFSLVGGALLFSFLVGSISGVLPALQASRMNPVDALRYE
jgi:putative ABC transport system permease protein